jgi:hypothetical protein
MTGMAEGIAQQIDERTMHWIVVLWVFAHAAFSAFLAGA